MTEPLGERLTSTARCLRLPATWLDGDFIDAALAMHLAHNLAVLQRESVRHLVASLGPGAITNGVRGYTFSGTELHDRREPTAYVGVQSIAWDSQTARRFGPLLLIADKHAPAEAPTFRTVRVSLDVNATNATFFACLTAANALPDTAHLGFTSAGASSGRATVTLDINPSPSTPTEMMPARRPDASRPELVACAVVSLWVGFYGVSGTNELFSINAFEVR